MDIVDLFFPRQCLGCKRTGRYICSICLGEHLAGKQFCPICNRPSIDGVTHIKCKKPHGLDGLYYAWRYKGAVRKAIIGLKYRYAKQIAREFSEDLSKIIAKDRFLFPKKVLLTPIPLYWFKRNQRGFNQAEEVGNIISRNLDWDYEPDLLIRKRHKRPQSELRKSERMKNIRGVFTLNPILDKQIIGNQPLILFDDVYTTGSTLKEAAKVLKRSGASEVWGLTLAR